MRRKAIRSFVRGRVVLGGGGGDRPPGASFPDGKPIEMTVMFGAGSAADVTARHLAEGMAKR